MHTYLTHPDWPAFVAAIRATPDDDLPRLVAADFLDEIGCHERADFIRVQVELTKYGPRSAARVYHNQQVDRRWGCQPSCVICELERSHRLLNWGPARGWVLADRDTNVTDDGWSAMGETNPLVMYSRGFVSGVTCPFDWWAERADVICAESVGLAVTLMTAAEWEDYPEGAPAYRLAGREETFGEREVLDASDRQPSTGAALCALTWPSVKSWTITTSRRLARPLVTPPTPAAPGTSP